ncbi:CHASE2 domain-containing protein [Burkholderia stagnalis]
MGRRFVLECVLIALLMPPLLWWLQAAPGVTLVDAMLYDWTMSRQRVAPSSDVLIVGIDARSLRELGPWPWPRGTHAQLLDTLARDGAQGVLLDVFLDDASTDADDRRLAAAMTKLPVYLPLRVAARQPDDAPDFVPPLPLFARNAAGTGHADVAVDMNGLSRWMYLHEGPPGRLAPYVGAWLATPAGLAPPAHASAAAHGGDWLRRTPFGFPLTQTLHGWRTVSYVSLLRGQVPAEFVRGKQVLVGALEDAHLERAVSVGTHGGVVSLAGIELQADAIDALRHGRAVYPLSRAAVAFWAALPIWLALALFTLAPRHGWAVVLALSGAWLAASAALVAYAHVWLPPLSTLLGLAAAYFLWSWRRLSAFFHFFSRRIAMLNALPAGAFEPAGQRPARNWDRVAARMAELDAAIGRVARIKSMLSITLSQMPVAVLVCLDDGTITQSNDAARRLLAAPDAADRDDGLRGRDLPSILLEAGGTMRARPAGPAWFDTLQREYTTLRDQVFKPRVAALDGVGDEPRRWMVALHDVTNEHRIERERAQWIGYISHDLRTPQINIISLLNLYAAGAAPFDARALLDGVRRETERSIKLADSILDLVTARSNRYRFEMAPIASIVLDAIDQVWANAASNDISIDARIADDDALLRADGALLTRAFVNLLHNAIRHSAPGGTIDVCVAVDRTPPAPRIHVAVRDEGEGMAREQAARLFDGPPAARAPARATGDEPAAPREIRSHGMGIPMVAEVVARHDGRITAYSLPDAGATFLLDFPLLDDPAY